MRKEIEMGVVESDLRVGEPVYLREHTSGSLCLMVKRDGQEHTVLWDDGDVRCFDDIGDVMFFCLERGLPLRREVRLGLKKREERKLLPAPSRKGVTEVDLKRGETVYLSQHASGSWCLLVRRYGLMCVVLCNDGSTKLFDGRGEAALYCRDKGLFLSEEWERCVVREKHLLPSGAPEKPSSLEREELLPPLDPEWREAFVEAVRNQALEDFERLVFLTEERERLLEELSFELIRREARGNKSCLCRTCRHVLENPVREVQEKIDKIWSWWTTSLGTTPADIVAGRWS